MSVKALEKIKYGDRVISVLTSPKMFEEIRRSTFLDQKTLQTCLANLTKHGYIKKDERGQYVNAESEVHVENS